jgi:hypothetical protein
MGRLVGDSFVLKGLYAVAVGAMSFGGVCGCHTAWVMERIIDVMTADERGTVYAVALTVIMIFCYTLRRVI